LYITGRVESQEGLARRWTEGFYLPTWERASRGEQKIEPRRGKKTGMPLAKWKTKIEVPTAYAKPCGGNVQKEVGTSGLKKQKFSSSDVAQKTQSAREEKDGCKRTLVDKIGNLWNLWRAILKREQGVESHPCEFTAKRGEARTSLKRRGLEKTKVKKGGGPKAARDR